MKRVSLLQICRSVGPAPIINYELQIELKLKFIALPAHFWTDLKSDEHRDEDIAQRGLHFTSTCPELDQVARYL